MGPKELAQIIKDHEGTITAYKQKIRTTITTKTREDLFEQNCKYHREQIAAHESKLADLIYVKEHADDIIAEAEEVIKRLRREITLMKNQHGVAALLKLAQQINDMNLDEEEEDEE
jgi:hypothetical protein